MFGHYGTAICAGLLVTFTTIFFTLMATALAGDINSPIGICLYLGISFILSVLSGLFTSGISYFYLKIACGKHVSAGDVFHGFRNTPDKALRIQLWISLFTFTAELPAFFMGSRLTLASSPRELAAYAACTVLSGIMPFILNLFYGQAFFLLHDFPHYSGQELLSVSRRMTRGHRLRLLYLYISFIPYLIPVFLSCGIAMLWVLPYMNATLTEFYLDLVRNSGQEEVVS